MNRAISRRGLLLAILLTAAIASVAAYVMWTYTVKVTVQEAFQVSTNLPDQFNIYPGETKTYTITVTNLASGKLKAEIHWEEIENPNNVKYEVHVQPPSKEIAPKATENFTVEIKVKGDSPTGTFKLRFSVDRKA
mgnify:CR=1 FL=1